jgi:hypothetical protein
MIQLALLALLQQKPPAPPPRIEIPRVDTAVVIDGVLDESIWQQATSLGSFHQYEPVDSRPAEENTEVRVWYAPDAIYFGVHAYDRQADRIRATHADRDNIDGEDHIVIYLDTFADRRRAFMFGANPLGIQMDGVRTEGAASAGRMFGGNTDKNPDFLFESRGRLTEDGYVVEIRIPFKTLRFPTSPVQDWGLQVERVTQRTGYRDTWTDVRRASASYLLQAGTIVGLHDLHRGVVTETQPFVTLANNGARSANGVFERDDSDVDAGANLKLSFTSISLDATINPDFSQVESDAGQVTINERFALFFPEKRPFFLDGIELFNTPSQLVYTRQIADPIGGVKVTGKAGPIAVAYLTALDENVDADGNRALFNITRLRRDIGPSSLVGLTATDRSVLSDPAFNRVVAADTRIVFGGLYFVEAQLGGSWTRDTAEYRDTQTHTGELWKVEFDRTGRSWGFNYNLNASRDNFVSRAGFIQRNGVVNFRTSNRLTKYYRRGSALETITAFFGPTWIWSYRDFDVHDPVERSLELNTTFRFRGGWSANFGIDNGSVDFDANDYERYTTNNGGIQAPYAALDGVAGSSFSFRGNTPTYQRFDASASFSRGTSGIFQEGSKGTGTNASVQLSLRPSASMRISAGTQYRRIDRSRNGAEFARSIIPRLQAEYQPSRALFFRAVTEYVTERQAALVDARTGEPLFSDGAPVAGHEANGLRIDLLTSYEPTPGTVAYFGYGSSLDGVEAFRFADLARSTDGFFVKLAYLFRR